MARVHKGRAAHEMGSSGAYTTIGTNVSQRVRPEDHLWTGHEDSGGPAAMRGTTGDVKGRAEGQGRRPPLRPSSRGPDWSLPSANSDMIGWSRILLSHTLDTAHSY